MEVASEHKPIDNFSGMFAYQVSLLVHYYGKQATTWLDRTIGGKGQDPANELKKTKQMRRKEQFELLKSIKYLEFFEALLQEEESKNWQVIDKQLLEHMRGTELPEHMSEAFAFDEQLNRLQQIAAEKVMP